MEAIECIWVGAWDAVVLLPGLQLIAKSDNKTAAPPWPYPYETLSMIGWAHSELTWELENKPKVWTSVQIFMRKFIPGGARGPFLFPYKFHMVLERLFDIGQIIVRDSEGTFRLSNGFRWTTKFPEIWLFFRPNLISVFRPLEMTLKFTRALHKVNQNIWPACIIHFRN